jgi:hypothetical protein
MEVIIMIPETPQTSHRVDRSVPDNRDARTGDSKEQKAASEATEVEEQQEGEDEDGTTAELHDEDTVLLNNEDRTIGQYIKSIPGRIKDIPEKIKETPDKVKDLTEPRDENHSNNIPSSSKAAIISGTIRGAITGLSAMGLPGVPITAIAGSTGAYAGTKVAEHMDSNLAPVYGSLVGGSIGATLAVAGVAALVTLMGAPVTLPVIAPAVVAGGLSAAAGSLSGANKETAKTGTRAGYFYTGLPAQLLTNNPVMAVSSSIAGGVGGTGAKNKGRALLGGLTGLGLGLVTGYLTCSPGGPLVSGLVCAAAGGGGSLIGRPIHQTVKNLHEDFNNKLYEKVIEPVLDKYPLGKRGNLCVAAGTGGAVGGLMGGMLGLSAQGLAVSLIPGIGVPIALLGFGLGASYGGIKTAKNYLDTHESYTAMQCSPEVKKEIAHMMVELHEKRKNGELPEDYSLKPKYLKEKLGMELEPEITDVLGKCHEKQKLLFENWTTKKVIEEFDEQMNELEKEGKIKEGDNCTQEFFEENEVILDPIMVNILGFRNYPLTKDITDFQDQKGNNLIKKLIPS